MVVSSTSKRRPLWVLAAGFTNGSRAEPPTTELGSENSGRPALPGEWRRRRPGGVASVGASRQEPFGLHSPGKAQLPQNPGATQERPEATTLGATGGRSAPLVRLETTGGRSALPGEWRRRRPGGVASVGACRQEPFGLHSPGKAQLPQNPGATQERPEATTLGATGGRPAPLVRLEATGGRSAPLVRLEATGGRSALPGEWRRRRPGGVASVGASRQEPFGLHSPGKAQLPQNPGATQERPEATTLGATSGRSALLVRLEATGGRPALPGEWRRRRPGGVASVGACRQEPFGLHSPGKAQLPQNPGALPTKPSALPHKT